MHATIRFVIWEQNHFWSLNFEVFECCGSNQAAGPIAAMVLWLGNKADDNLSVERIYLTNQYNRVSGLLSDTAHLIVLNCQKHTGRCRSMDMLGPSCWCNSGWCRMTSFYSIIIPLIILFLRRLSSGILKWMIAIGVSLEVLDMALCIFKGIV